MQYSWLPDTRRALHWRKTALSSVMSFHPSYLTHTACFRLPDKPDICLSFPINAGVRWEKSRWHVQSQERGCPPDNNMRAMPHRDSPSLQWGSAARLCLPTSELSSTHPTPLFLLLIPSHVACGVDCVLVGLGSARWSTAWSIFSSGKPGWGLNAPPVRVGFCFNQLRLPLLLSCHKHHVKHMCSPWWQLKASHFKNHRGSVTKHQRPIKAGREGWLPYRKGIA